MKDWRVFITTNTSSSNNNSADLLRIDYNDLYNPDIHLPSAPVFDSIEYEAETPLSAELIALIGVTGRPISVAHYMNAALQHPEYGYYTNAKSNKSADNDDDDFDQDDIEIINDKKNVDDNTVIIGAGGDFVTAPEISQMFGECLAVWFATQFNTANLQSHFQWLECGPGKGSLMVDLLCFQLQLRSSSTTEVSSWFGNACRRIHFIETSPELRRINKTSKMLKRIVIL
jgi:NADH dehydrogenase [ubiquinone] 1 alpha subcomplex assembly factor 7